MHVYCCGSKAIGASVFSPAYITFGFVDVLVVTVAVMVFTAIYIFCAERRKGMHVSRDACSTEGLPRTCVCVCHDDVMRIEDSCF